jgi:hypothetical protein
MVDALETYTMKIQEQCMELKWHKKNYKLYGFGNQNLPLKVLTNPMLPP